MLNVHNLSAGWGHGQVLHGVDLTVAPRTITALVGANGAGKTTTLMAISNLVPSRSGTVHLGATDLTALPAQAVVAAGVVHCPEGRRVFAGMSVAENLDLGAYLRNDAQEVAQDLERAYARFPLLYERRHQLAGTLSGGEQQMLAIARALMARPQILLLDEPSLGLAPQVTEKLFATIVQLASEGQGILLVEQNAALALQVAHEALVLDHGHVTLRGKSQDLARDPRVQRAYLGG